MVTESRARPAGRPAGPVRRVLCGVLCLAAIGGALYLNRSSERWVAEADRKVSAARGRQAAAAFSELEDRARKQPEDAPVQLAYARALLERHALAAALIPAERAVRCAPDSVEAHLTLADIYAPLDYGSEAAAHYRRAIRLAPRDLTAYQRLGDLLRAGGRPGEAERVYREARNRVPAAMGPRVSLASLYLDQGSADRALEELDPVVADPAAPVSALFLAGRACQTAGKTERGTELLRRAIRLQPDFAAAHHALGAILANEGRYEQGIPALRRAVELAPGDAVFRYALANALRSDRSRPDNLREALREYELSLEADPGAPWTHYYYGVTLEELGEREASAREYRRALELDPKFGSAHYRLGVVYRALGRPEDARRHFETFDRESHAAIADVHGRRRAGSVLDTAEEHYRRGLEALRKGDRGRAMAAFRVALERDPTHGSARRRLRELGDP